MCQKEKRNKIKMQSRETKQSSEPDMAQILLLSDENF